VLPAERVFGAVRAGLRYARGSPQLVSVLVRAGAFYLFASAVWALLPLVARVEFGLGAGGYGVLLALLGAGGVAGAFLLPRIRERVSADRVVLLATLTFAASTGALAWVRNLYAACAAAALTGVAWIGVLSCLNVAAQRAVPSWVRARGLSVYLAVFFGALTAGSALWGAVASRLGNPSALLLAAGGMAAGLVATRGFPLPDEEEIDLAPSTHWPAPLVSEEPELHRGPILVTTEYRIAPDRAEEFAALMRGLQRIRRREGAHYWELFQDAGDPTRFVEIFLVESWVEHLRQHERVTVADRQVQERAAAFHAGDEPPVVTHFLAASPSKEFLGGHGG
jgi:MFS family permease